MSFNSAGVSVAVQVYLMSFNFAGVPVAVQVESLHSFVFLCSQIDESLHFELLGEFPSLLVPLSSDNKVLNLFLEAYPYFGNPFVMHFFSLVIFRISWVGFIFFIISGFTGGCHELH